MSTKLSQIANVLTTMTIGELTQLVQELCITATVQELGAFVAIHASPAVQVRELQEVTYEVYVCDGPKFIQSIKAIRAVLGIGLKDAKDRFDAIRGTCGGVIVGTYVSESAANELAYKIRTGRIYEKGTFGYGRDQGVNVHVRRVVG